MTLIRRLLCAFRGHRWQGRFAPRAGELAGFRCRRCGAFEWWP